MIYLLEKGTEKYPIPTVILARTDWELEIQSLSILVDYVSGDSEFFQGERGLRLPSDYISARSAIIICTEQEIHTTLEALKYIEDNKS